MVEMKQTYPVFIGFVRARLSGRDGGPCRDDEQDVELHGDDCRGAAGRYLGISVAEKESLDINALNIASMS